MNTKQTHDLSAQVQGVRRRFERWRRTHKARSPIPDWLWASAVVMAGTYGLHRTAKALRLDYYSLKKRVQQEAADARRVPARDGAATFLELTPPASAGPCRCLLELEDGRGAKMRVALKGVAAPDLAALSRSFWNRGP